MANTILANELLTLGQVADQLGESMQRVGYAIRRYGIEPAGRVGILRVWSRDDLPHIKSAVRRVASNRRGGL